MYMLLWYVLSVMHRYEAVFLLRYIIATGQVFFVKDDELAEPKIQCPFTELFLSSKIWYCLDDYTRHSHNAIFM